MTPKSLLTSLNDADIAAAITEAESRTSGEIRVFVSHATADNPLVAARDHFHRLKMTATRDRNAVLIFIAPKSQTFALFGDVNIDAKLGPDAWKAIAHNLGLAFGEGRWTQGLIQAISAVGSALAIHFPANARDNPDELPNTVERDLPH